MFHVVKDTLDACTPGYPSPPDRRCGTSDWEILGASKGDARYRRQLRYVEGGKGDPIIFIHGGLTDFTGDHRMIAYGRRYNYPNDNKPEMNYSPVVDAEDLAALVKKLDS
jgi:hypothetical protein